MGNQNDENVKGRFEKFLNPREAKQAAEDIRQGEQILRDNPTPMPDEMLIADIKDKTAEATSRKRADTFRRAVYKTAAVAAAFIILAVVSVKLSERNISKPEKRAVASIIPAAIWESENLDDDDADLATLTAEIEQIESELLAVQLGENGTDGGDDIVELEMELIEINSNFWKG